ncbi:MAG: hypothetical protein OXH76_08905, partial [Boseongicola sp.]|nr:hypothetical protein [Boseongicola sp.]
MRQLEDFAKATRVPFGFLFLQEPPAMNLPFADFRTVESRRPQGISPELMDTVHLMLRRQARLREERMGAEAEPVSLVGAARLSDHPEATGREKLRAVGLDEGCARRVPTWTAAVGELESTAYLVHEIGGALQEDDPCAARSRSRRHAGSEPCSDSECSRRGSK